ncbi:MAG: response regulator [Pseudohongiellaceae bacterium]
MTRSNEDIRQSATEPEATEATTVLLVEDDKALRELLRSGQDMQGFTILEADSKQTALACLDSHDLIDIMILDLGLPPSPHTTEEGLSIIRKTRADFYQTKIIVLTGQDEEQSALEAIREGAFDFLSKPAHLDEILNSINRAVLFLRKEKDMSAAGMARLQIDTRVSDGLKGVREEAEEKLVRQVLKETGFNIYQSAAKLGVKRESIYYFMKKFKISRGND